MPPMEESSVITLACPEADFSASKIAHAVEDCNAHLVNLNVTADHTPDGQLVVELRTNHRNADAVARSLARYGYETLSAVAYPSEGDDTSERLRQNAAELLHILQL